MINPLLHPYSSSAPTSPRCTRSALGNFMNHVIHKIVQKNESKMVCSWFEKRSKIYLSKYVSHGLWASPIEFNPQFPPVVLRVHRQRRLSRVVKCRTVDFAEFPEGMRDYQGKPRLREIHSQPGSPVIPRIEIHDFGSEVFKTFFLVRR